jgi:hypothetical protein
VRRACSARRRPWGLRAKLATLLMKVGDMAELMCPDADGPNVWGIEMTR